MYLSTYHFYLKSRETERDKTEIAYLLVHSPALPFRVCVSRKLTLETRTYAIFLIWGVEIPSGIFF